MLFLRAGGFICRQRITWGQPFPFLFTYFLHKYNVTDQLSVFILFSSIFVIQLQVSNSGGKRMYLFLNICQTSRLITRKAVWLTAIIKSRCCSIVSKQAMQRKKRITSSDLASFVTFTPIYSLLAFLAYSFSLCAIWMDRFGMSLMSLFVDKG